MMDIALQMDDELCVFLGERLKRERLINKMSQKDLAELTGLSIDKVRRIEQKGDAKLIDIVTILRGLGRIDYIGELFDFEQEDSALPLVMMKDRLNDRERKRIHKKRSKK
jgi:transcriptional regulator with XRE-family HTH domain